MIKILFYIICAVVFIWEIVWICRGIMDVPIDVKKILEEEGRGRYG